jgi:hypothetical protein
MGKRQGKIKEYLKELGIIPQYTEISLFLIGLTLLLFLFANFTIIKDAIGFFIDHVKNINLNITDFLNSKIPTKEQKVIDNILDSLLAIIIIGGVLGALVFGWFLSIYHVFAEKPMSIFEKKLILFFVTLTLIIVAISAYFHSIEKVLESKQSIIWFIFPVFNLVGGFLFLALAFPQEDVVSPKLIADKQAKREEVIVGTIAVFIIFFISNYILKNHWSITFSICTSYAALFNEMISRLLFRKNN